MTHSGNRLALILIPILLVGLMGGFAWSQRSGGSGGPRGERLHAARGEHGDHHGRWRRGRGSAQWMAEELGLNDAQRKAIGNILIETHKKNIKLRADARVARIELGQLITQGEADQAAVEAKVDQISKLRSDIMRERAGAAVAVRELLTPEQREKAESMLRRLLRGPRRHRRG